MFTSIQVAKSVPSLIRYFSSGEGHTEGHNRYEGWVGNGLSLTTATDDFNSWMQLRDNPNTSMQGFSLVLSADPSEFNADDPEDVLRFLEFAQKTSDQTMPGCPSIWFAQRDGKSGLLHAHGLVANVQKSNGRAMPGSWRHLGRLRGVVDDLLLAEHGLDNKALMAERAKPDWKEELKRQLLVAVQPGSMTVTGDQSKDTEVLGALLAEHGLTVHMRGKTKKQLSVSLNGDDKRKVRLTGSNRQLGEEFSLDSLLERAGTQVEAQREVKAPQMSREDAFMAEMMQRMKQDAAKNAEQIGRQITGSFESSMSRLQASLDAQASPQRASKPVEVKKKPAPEPVKPVEVVETQDQKNWRAVEQYFATLRRAMSDREWIETDLRQRLEMQTSQELLGTNESLNYIVSRVQERGHKRIEEFEAMKLDSTKTLEDVEEVQYLAGRDWREVQDEIKTIYQVVERDRRGLPDPTKKKRTAPVQPAPRPPSKANDRSFGDD